MLAVLRGLHHELPGSKQFVLQTPLFKRKDLLYTTEGIQSQISRRKILQIDMLENHFFLLVEILALQDDWANVAILRKASTLQHKAL